MSNQDDLPPILITTYLGRLILRTHLPCDNGPIAAIYSRPEVMKHLSALAPPSGWTPDRTRGTWLPSDIAARAVQRQQSRRETRSCTLICLVVDTGDWFASTGFPRIEPAGTPGRKAELGIVSNVGEQFARKGYATEALHGSVNYAFEELEAVEEIIIRTREVNLEMRGWCENVAGLKVKRTEDNEVSGKTVEYSFSRAAWEQRGGVRERLEAKMNKYRVV